jgi:hypothetical protein
MQSGQAAESVGSSLFSYSGIEKMLKNPGVPTRGLDYDHMIKARAHKGGVRIDKTPKKLASICCPQRRETKADTLKQLRPIGKGEQVLEKRLDQKELT